VLEQNGEGKMIEKVTNEDILEHIGGKSMIQNMVISCVEKPIGLTIF